MTIQHTPGETRGTELVFSDQQVTALDRCDRCGPAAQAIVVFRVNGSQERVEDAGSLGLCAHCLRAHADALADRNVEIVRADAIAVVAVTVGDKR
jgi:hypothetical protein